MEALTTSEILSQSVMLTHEQLCALHVRAVGAKRQILDVAAFNAIVLANVRLVWARAAKASSHVRANGALDSDDLFNLGIIGLMEATKRFNPHKGNQFSTYATWWIRQKIHRALEDHGSTVRVPNHRHADIRRMLRKETQLWLEMERPPTDGELSAALGMSAEFYHEIRRSHRANQWALPLEAPLKASAPTMAGGGRIDEENMTLGACLADPDEMSQPGSDAHLEKLSQREILDAAVRHAGLTLREGMVIAYRFGFATGGSWSLEELGKKLKITRERVRQIEQVALAKLAKGARIAGYGPAELHLVMPTQQEKTQTAAKAVKKQTTMVTKVKVSA